MTPSGDRRKQDNRCNAEHTDGNSYYYSLGPDGKRNGGHWPDRRRSSGDVPASGTEQNIAQEHQLSPRARTRLEKFLHTKRDYRSMDSSASNSPCKVCGKQFTEHAPAPLDTPPAAPSKVEQELDAMLSGVREAADRHERKKRAQADEYRRYAAAPPSPPSEGREQFETLAAELGFPLTRSHIDEPGMYLNENTRGAWQIWQAARASVPAAPEEKPREIAR